MAKRVMSFKPTAEVEVQLAELMDSWCCDRTAAVNRAIAISHEQCVKSNIKLAEGLSPGRLRAAAEPVRKIHRPDPDKIAEFQRRTGMSGKKRG